MNFISSLAVAIDRLDPAIGNLLAHFRDAHVPVELSAAILGAAALLLIAVLTCGLRTVLRIGQLRRAVRACGTGGAFAAGFAPLDRALSVSIFGAAWRAYRQTLRQSRTGILYLRAPGEFIGLHTIEPQIFPARFFAAAHGYFIGIGLLLTFIGLVAALKFAATGIASSDVAQAKEALNALLAAAAFKFMTSIAGLGSSLILSVAARATSYAVENAAGSLARELEGAMEPVFTEALAYDQLAATRAQIAQLERIETGLRAAPTQPQPAAPAPAASEQNEQAMQRVLTAFAAEMRGAAGSEIKELTGKLGEVASAIATMQTHLGRSGNHFAGQVDLAAGRLISAATTLQETVARSADRAEAQLDTRLSGLSAAFERGETLLSQASEKAASALRHSSGELDASLRSQIASMRDIVQSLDHARDALKDGAAVWTQATTPVMESVNASRQIATELKHVAGQVGAAQHDMAEMAKSVAQMTDRMGAVWDNYRTRFEKVDDELQAVFERLQGGTRAFGDEVMDFVTKLDASLANGMQAFSLGTEELREIAQMFVIQGDAKAA